MGGLKSVLTESERVGGGWGRGVWSMNWTEGSCLGINKGAQDDGVGGLAAGVGCGDASEGQTETARTVQVVRLLGIHGRTR